MNSSLAVARDFASKTFERICIVAENLFFFQYKKQRKRRKISLEADINFKISLTCAVLKFPLNSTIRKLINLN